MGDDRAFGFTPEQSAAIDYRGGALLVSAAAGSGKTRVLVERLLSRVDKDKDTNIDEFLVITYTRAAALELREKIYDEILKRLADSPGNRRLRRQSLLCRGAPIGTIHSFCTDILRENAHLIGLAPDFRVADESEGGIIKAEVLERVINGAYEKPDSDESAEHGTRNSELGGTAPFVSRDGFLELVDLVSPGRDDRRLVGIILETHAKLQSNPSPQDWAQRQKEELNLAGVADVSETSWGAYLVSKVRSAAAFWRNQMEELCRRARAFPDFEKAYGSSIEGTLNSIEAFQAALDMGWDEARRMSGIEFTRPKAVKGYDDLKDVRLRCKDAMKKCSAIFECSSEELLEDMRAVAPPMAALLDLVMAFDKAYAEEKRRRGIVDFSDLEHLTLSILVDKETGEKTALAQTISQRYKEIMVDEYQDVNAVQEMIFNAVSQGGSIFMVGDVKQSIYRFRLADPSIFLDKYERFVDAGGGKSVGSAVGAKIRLSKNFRSCAGVLEAVNFVFSRIMSVDFGEMDYSENERLVHGRDEGAGDGGSRELEPVVEMNVIDMSGLEEDEESPAKTQVEARFIAERIAELCGGRHLITDGNGGRRKVRYSDIVILLRSIRGKAWQYAAMLAEHGIPVDMPGGEGFFETHEISAALSLLSVIDNPMQDIPLVAALSGPVFGFTADELAEIRSKSKHADFYGALSSAANSEASMHEEAPPPVDGELDNSEPRFLSCDLSRKCAAFLREIDSMRLVMPDMPADRFIWHVYNKTGLLERVGAMRNGEKRCNNLILLAESARSYEQNGYKGLFGFLAYVKGLRERGAEPMGEGASSASGDYAPNLVRIMSIHKSKGLEFPVVILADTAKNLNNRDAQQPLVMHPDLGVGPMRTDRQRRISYTTIARMAVQSKLTSEMMAEELRILYVAMTRAREKLIVTAAFKDAEREMEKWEKMLAMDNGLSGGTFAEGDSADEKIAPQLLEDIKSMAGWILIANSGLASTKGAIAVSVFGAGELGGQENFSSAVPGAYAPAEMDASIPVGDDAFAHPQAQIFKIKEASQESQKSQSLEVLSQGTFTYPYAKATELPSKLTVTGLRGLQSDQEAAVLHQVLKSRPYKMPFEYSKPKFIAEKTGLSAAERGTAFHLALQHVDFQNCVSLGGVAGEIEALVEKGLLSQEQADSIDMQKITRFLESDIGKRVVTTGEVWREFKFSLLYPAEHFFQGGGDDEILFQGVIDCFFEEGGELTVVDFKTDYVTDETVDEKARQYAPQLAAYAHALERITKKRVKEQVVYFFFLDRGVAIRNLGGVYDTNHRNDS
ncbi:MAG: helicase-exonuclease AddAB subunit AddA [Oscillospiraceae bacterium]|nr:helicase-exonuclease AddAB subunit AddA [Oscillospiraceae bacterium]